MNRTDDMQNYGYGTRSLHDANFIASNSYVDLSKLPPVNNNPGANYRSEAIDMAFHGRGQNGYNGYNGYCYTAPQNNYNFAIPQQYSSKNTAPQQQGEPVSYEYDYNYNITDNNRIYPIPETAPVGITYEQMSRPYENLQQKQFPGEERGDNAEIANGNDSRTAKRVRGKKANSALKNKVNTNGKIALCAYILIIGIIVLMVILSSTGVGVSNASTQPDEGTVIVQEENVALTVDSLYEGRTPVTFSPDYSTDIKVSTKSQTEEEAPSNWFDKVCDIINVVVGE